MENTNLFEIASRKQYRFTTDRGEVTVEDLWNMPLDSSNGFNLDAVATDLDAKITIGGKKSFVRTKSVEDTDLNNRFEIVKHIISIKLEEKAEAETASTKKAEKARLLMLLDRKKDEELENLSAEEIEAKIAELG